MDRVEQGSTVETDGGMQESFGATMGLESRRMVVEFLTILVAVVTVAAATSVVLLPP